VTEPDLPRSGVPSVDRCPSRAALTATTWPSWLELQHRFAFAVSLKARPPFTYPRTHGRETLLWARYCLPTSATQHDARAQPRKRRSGKQEGAVPSSPLLACCRLHRQEKNARYFTQRLSRTRTPTSEALLERILRSSCRVEKRTPAEVQGSKGSTRKLLPFSLHLGHPPSQSSVRSQGWNSLRPARARLEPRTNPPREGKIDPDGPGCLPPSRGYGRLCTQPSFLPCSGLKRPEHSAPLAPLRPASSPQRLTRR